MVLKALALGTRRAGGGFTAAQVWRPDRGAIHPQSLLVKA